MSNFIHHTLEEAFAKQLNETKPVTTDYLNTAIAIREAKEWSTAEIDSYFDGVEVGKSKHLSYLLRGISNQLEVHMVFDHRVAALATDHFVISMPSTECASPILTQEKHIFNQF